MAKRSVLPLLKVAVFWSAETEQILARGGHGRIMNYNELICADTKMLRHFLRGKFICTSLVQRRWRRLLKDGAKQRITRKLRPPTWKEPIRPGETRPKGATTPSQLEHPSDPTSYLVGVISARL